MMSLIWPQSRSRLTNTQFAVSIFVRTESVSTTSSMATTGGALCRNWFRLVAVSLDGAPETHIELRGDAHAFLRAERAMDRLAAVGARFGLAYCMSKESIRDMPWAAEFALAKGAGLVQFHPFAPIGRGRSLANRLGLNEADKARAYVIGALLDTGDGPVIQMDLAPVEAARERRNDYAVLDLEDVSGKLLSDI